MATVMNGHFKQIKSEIMDKLKKIIANATLAYNPDGTLESATLWPVKITKDDFVNALGDCKNKTLEDVTKTAELMLGAYFNKMNEVELRDVETTELKAEVINCQKYDNGTLRHVEIKFIYKNK